MKIKNRFLVIDILILIALLGLPMIILGVCKVLPKGTASGILFYVIFGLSIVWHLVWMYLTFKKGKHIEDALFFKQYVLSEIILLLPFINLIIYYIPFNETAKFVVTIILDFIIFVGYYIYYSMLAHVSNKMSDTLKQHESVRINPTKVESYNNDDGDFVGSSIRKK